MPDQHIAQFQSDERQRTFFNSKPPFQHNESKIDEMSMFGIYASSQMNLSNNQRSAGAGSMQRKSLQNKNRGIMLGHTNHKKADFLIQGVNNKERQQYIGSPEKKNSHSQYDATLPKLRSAYSVDPNRKKMQMRYLESIKKSEYELPKAL